MEPVEPILQFFAYEHLPPNLRSVSKPFCELAHAIVLGDNCPESGNMTLGPPMPRNAERSVTLRKLLEAKDAAVRAMLAKVGVVILSLLLLASQADAQGPIRRLLFGHRVQRCEPTNNFRDVPKVSADIKPCLCEACPDCKECCKDGVCDVSSDIVRISSEEMEGILQSLAKKPEWKNGVAITRKQFADWKGEKTVLVNYEAYKAWQKAIGVTDIPMRSLDAKTFDGALQTQLAAKKSLSPGERRLLRILNSEDSPCRDRQLARMERLVRADLNLPAGPVDWSAVDWPSVLAQVLQLLVQLLPLFL